jgi:hypothetical protein
MFYALLVSAGVFEKADVVRGLRFGDKSRRSLKVNFPATSPTPQPTNWPELRR